MTQPITIEQTTEQTTDIDKILNGRLNHALWISLLDLYNDICVNGGIIFGGAVRDNVKRTLGANKFYEYCANEMLYSKKLYNDENIHKDTFDDRTLLPNDIDIYIKENDYKKLIIHLGKKYKMKEGIGNDDICYFFRNNKLFNEALEYKRRYIHLLPAHDKILTILLGEEVSSKNTQVKLDFIVLKKEYLEHKEANDGGLLYPPFGNPDFDINQLCMLKSSTTDMEIVVLKSLLRYDLPQTTQRINSINIVNTLNIMEIKINIMKEVFDNIENSIAVPLFPDIEQIKAVFGNDYKIGINYRRSLKMFNKGYCINGNKTLAKFKYIKYSRSDEIYNDEDKCIICLDIFSLEKRWFQFGCKCNVKMHVECYAKYFRKPSLNIDGHITCPHCRRILQYTCPCKLLNFMSSINHCLRKIDNDISEQCTKCLDNNTHNPCLKWYYPCKVCDIDE
jgi:hypothetical protein